MTLIPPASQPDAAEYLDPSERTKCDIWTRVMGYLQTISRFNPGKKSEHKERLPYDISEVIK